MPSPRGLLFIYSILICTVVSYAQSSYYVNSNRRFFGGLVAGANFSQVDGDNYKGYDKIGLNIGGKVYTPLGEDMAVSMEILYSQRGSYGKDATDLGVKGIFVSNYRINLEYAEVPVVVHFFLPGNHHIGGGLSYSRLVQSKETATTSPVQQFDQFKYPFNKSAFDFVLDGNIRITKGLFFSPRFSYSLAKIRSQKNVPKYFGRDQFSNVFSLRVTYLFGLKDK